MTKDEAIELGKRDGIGDVEQVLELQGRDVVIATLRPGHLSWDEDAINAGAHTFAGVPEEYRAAYYEEYARAARERAGEIRDGQLARFTHNRRA